MNALDNQVLITAVIASLLAQSIKVFLIWLVEGSWQLGKLAETGGMPSSHSAMVVALATGVGLRSGWHGSLFAVATVFALIVMYDSSGVRRSAGMQAGLINDLLVELQAVVREGFRPEPLKVLLGHTYFEVVVGALLGVAVALASFRLF